VEKLNEEEGELNWKSVNEDSWEVTKILMLSDHIKQIATKVVEL